MAYFFYTCGVLQMAYLWHHLTRCIALWRGQSTVIQKFNTADTVMEEEWLSYWLIRNSAALHGILQYLQSVT